MDTVTCPACRSVNQAGVPRCMNCGSLLEIPETPAGMDADGMPRPPPPQDAYGWNAMVATAPKATQRRSTVAIALGVLTVGGFLLLFLLGTTGNILRPGEFTTMWWGLALLSTAFWFWMLFDAVSNGRYGWAVAVFFLGTFGALAYALVAKSPPPSGL